MVYAFIHTLYYWARQSFSKIIILIMSIATHSSPMQVLMSFRAESRTSQHVEIGSFMVTSTVLLIWWQNKSANTNRKLYLGGRWPLPSEPKPPALQRCAHWRWARPSRRRRARRRWPPSSLAWHRPAPLSSSSPPWTSSGRSRNLQSPVSLSSVPVGPHLYASWLNNEEEVPGCKSTVASVQVLQSLSALHDAALGLGMATLISEQL